MPQEQVLLVISKSRKDNEIFLNSCAGGGDVLLIIKNNTPATLKRREITKHVIIKVATSNPDDCGEQFINTLEISPATARMFRLRDGFVYLLRYNVATKTLTIILTRTSQVAPFGIEQTNIK